MTEEAARKTANVLLAAAAVGGVFFVLRTPPLRRAAWRFGTAALTRGIPAWFAREVVRAWHQSGPRAG
jgi:hypothetical protein